MSNQMHPNPNPALPPNFNHNSTRRETKYRLFLSYRQLLLWPNKQMTSTWNYSSWILDWPACVLDLVSSSPFLNKLMMNQEKHKNISLLICLSTKYYTYYGAFPSQRFKTVQHAPLSPSILQTLMNLSRTQQHTSWSLSICCLHLLGSVSRMHSCRTVFSFFFFFFFLL